jgi:hypothetical protein
MAVAMGAQWLSRFHTAFRASKPPLVKACCSLPSSVVVGVRWSDKEASHLVVWEKNEQVASVCLWIGLDPVRGDEAVGSDPAGTLRRSRQDLAAVAPPARRVSWLNASLRFR